MIESFLNFEIENKLFDKKISDIKFWHNIRYSIYQEINQKVNNLGTAHNVDFKKGSTKHIAARLNQFKYLFRKNIFLNHSKRDILIFNHPRRILKDSLYHCLYTSDLAVKLDDKYLMIERPHDLHHDSPVPEDNIKYTDPINLEVTFKKLLMKLMKKEILSEIDKLYIKDLIQKLNQEYNIALDSNKWINEVENSLVFYDINYKSYKKIIKRIKPKVIVQVVSYSANLLVVNKIAKEMKIPTIELQHGTIGQNHIAYNFLYNQEIETLPDYLFTFGDYWKDHIRFPIKQSNIISVGWPYYEDKVQKQEQELKSNNKEKILFISQGTIGNGLSDIAVDLQKQLDSDKYDIIYKLHPGEYDVWRNEYPLLVDSQIQVIDHSRYDMHYYFNQSTIQIGVNSTAIFEGLGYNLETYIVTLPGFEFMKELQEKDVVAFVKNSNELYSSIMNKTVNSDKFDTSYFWKPHSMENMIEEINNIVNINF